VAHIKPNTPLAAFGKNCLETTNYQPRIPRQLTVNVYPSLRLMGHEAYIE
jgi:hypothetical protein